MIGRRLVGSFVVGGERAVPDRLDDDLAVGDVVDEVERIGPALDFGIGDRKVTSDIHGSRLQFSRTR
jgi:hypothetical protein